MANKLTTITIESNSKQAVDEIIELLYPFFWKHGKFSSAGPALIFHNMQGEKNNG